MEHTGSLDHLPSKKKQIRYAMKPIKQLKVLFAWWGQSPVQSSFINSFLDSSKYLRSWWIPSYQWFILAKSLKHCGGTKSLF